MLSPDIKLPQIEWKTLDELRLNPNNPRTITETAFNKLLNNLKKDPDFLLSKPLKVTPDGLILAGNQRYRACKELGFVVVPAMVVDYQGDKQNRYIVIDNVTLGQHDFDILSSMFDAEELEEMGIVPYFQGETNLEAFFEDAPKKASEDTQEIVLEYSSEDYEKVEAAFNSHTGSKEEVVFKLLGCK